MTPLEILTELRDRGDTVPNPGSLYNLLGKLIIDGVIVRTVVGLYSLNEAS